MSKKRKRADSLARIVRSITEICTYAGYAYEQMDEVHDHFKGNLVFVGVSEEEYEDAFQQARLEVLSDVNEALFPGPGNGEVIQTVRHDDAQPYFELNRRIMATDMTWEEIKLAVDEIDEPLVEDFWEDEGVSAFVRPRVVREFEGPDDIPILKEINAQLDNDDEPGVVRGTIVCRVGPGMWWTKPALPAPEMAAEIEQEWMSSNEPS